MRERTHNADDGVAALEFGLVLPLLMAILMGIIDYGHVYFVRLSMTNAAREGARVGATRTQDAVAPAAVAAASAYLADSGITGSVTATTPSDAAPTVRVSITLDPYEPLVGLVPTPDRLNVSAAMRWELASPEP
jgi:Flp pilus assembly protein TadG